MTVKFGFWTPVYNGWLRNIDDENVPLTWEYIKEVGQRAEKAGYELTLVPELFLNDVKGIKAPAFDSWTVAAALAATTEKIEILSALRPQYHPVALTAKQIAVLEDISKGRFSVNAVSAWWEEEARQYGIDFSEHDDRYGLTHEYFDVLRGLLTESPYTHHGKYFDFEGTYVEPKPAKLPLVYAGGESEVGRQHIAEFADAYLVHGATPEEAGAKIEDMKRRREELGKEPFKLFGMAAYIIVRDTEEEAQAELERIIEPNPNSAGYDSFKDFTSHSNLDIELSKRDYATMNRGLRPNFVGTPQQVAEKIKAFEEVGVSVLLIQSSPVIEELERIAEQVFPLVNG